MRSAGSVHSKVARLSSDFNSARPTAQLALAGVARQLGLHCLYARHYITVQAIMGVAYWERGVDGDGE